MTKDGWNLGTYQFRVANWT